MNVSTVIMFQDVTPARPAFRYAAMGWSGGGVGRCRIANEHGGTP